MMIRSTRVPLVVGVIGAVGIIAAGAAKAQFPDGPVTMIVPYAAGGNSDQHARLLQEPLSDALGADVVIRNVEGAAGTVGSAEIAQAGPDGYTLGMMPIAPPTMQPHMRDLPYDVDSFDPICMVDNNPVVLMVAADSDYQSLADLVAAGTDGDGTIPYGTTGGGTVPHLAAIGFVEETGIDATHVPFSNAADVMRAVMGGTVEFFIGPASLVERFDVRGLAIFAEEDVAAFPDIPTSVSQDLDLAFSIWGGIFAPAGLPDDVRETLIDACVAAMDDERTIEAMENISSNPGDLTGDDFAAFVMDQYEINGRLIDQADLD